MKYFLYIICFLLASGLGAQSDVDPILEKIDKIKLVSDPIDRDTQLIWQYSYISEELARTKDERTEAYIDTLKMLVDRTDWDNGKGFYYRAMGRYYDFGNKEGDKALEYYQKAIDAYKPAGGDYKELAFTYVLKGFFLSNSGLHEEVWPVFEEGIQYARKTNFKNSLCLMLDWMGDYYLYGLGEEKDYNKALDYYLQVNKILPEISYERIIAGNHSDLFVNYTNLDRPEDAQHHFLIADSIYSNTKSTMPHGQAALYSDMAQYLATIGKNKEAKQLMERMENVIASSNNIEFVSRYQHQLYEFYKGQGEYEKALSHYEQHVSMEDELEDEKVKSKYYEIEAKYNVALKEVEIQELREGSLKNIRNFLIALVSILLGAALVILNKNKAIRKSYTALEEKQKEVKKALYLGETHERQRVASELHDNVNTKLAAARWRLEAISNDVSGDAHDIVTSTIEMLEDAYQDVRHISHNLVPEKLEKEGLIKSINNLIRKLNSNGEINFSFKALPFRNNEITKIVYPLYNIVFELINNVMKHADATEVNISLEEKGNQLIAIVADNGKGYDVEKMKKGFGLRSIISRVESLNGHIDIASELGKGSTTTVIISI